MAFVGGLGLSAIVIVVLCCLAYFAGTAPQVPRSATALETLRPPDDGWLPPVEAKPLDNAAMPLHANAAPRQASILPRSTGPSQAPPIDISDLPPPDRSWR